MLTVDNLHEAADAIYSQEDMVLRIGLTPEVIREFIESTTWWDSPEKERVLKPDPLSLALGLAIGAAAMRIKGEEHGHDY